MTEFSHKGHWGLILGSSSGFGLAAAKELASRGMNIFGVHFDRKAAMEHIRQEIEEMQSHGVTVQYFNINAADEEKRRDAIAQMKETMGTPQPLRVLLHSLAFGSLKDYFAEEPSGELTQPQIEMTINVMANSLVYWTQDLRREGLIGSGSNIYGMTSEGGRLVWPYYGAVSAAKAALESHLRQIALELATDGVRANALCAGVTDTPALRKIPENENLLEGAKRKNPTGRLTTPEDVAKAIAVLSLPEAAWITGNVIKIDGGEGIVG